MSVESVPSPATYRDHLLSRTLYRELFRNNLVTRDGCIKGYPANLNKYRSCLERACAERRADLYKRRNELVCEAEGILKITSPLPSEIKRLKAIMDELELEFKDGKIEIPNKPLKVFQKYLGSKEPKLSIFERQFLEEIKRNKVLKRDLKVLDNWLEKISTPISKVETLRRVPSLSWKDFQRKHYLRQKKHWKEMEDARHTFIKDFHNYNQNAIRKLIASESSHEKQRIHRCSIQMHEKLFPKNCKYQTETSRSTSSKAPGNVDESRKFETEPSAVSGSSKDVKTLSETLAPSDTSKDRKGIKNSDTLDSSKTEIDREKSGKTKKEPSMSSKSPKNVNIARKTKVGSLTSFNKPIDRNKNRKIGTKSVDSSETSMDSSETPVDSSETPVDSSETPVDSSETPVDSDKVSSVKAESLASSDTSKDMNENSTTNTKTSTSLEVPDYMNESKTAKTKPLTSLETINESSKTDTESYAGSNARKDMCEISKVNAKPSTSSETLVEAEEESPAEKESLTSLEKQKYMNESKKR